MYLKRLEIKGFKSFADRTILDFNQGVACVVGPNGSGKSNITDAVRWVLGEQKVKTLRGSKMEDIIFNGTTHRPALGMAEVSLHFDNTNRYFPLDYTDVIVTRRIYKSGESEYLLNNTVCRLKDVKELFMDTGIGTDGYSIIGQGKIESILSGNGDDRRQVFEEAAGIVKYKSKKKEAVRKLENTELNLVRVEDIAGELKGRIEPLRKESEKAKEYLEVTEELKDIEINLFLNELDKVDGKLSKIEADALSQKEIYLGFKQTHDLEQEEVKQIEHHIFDFENIQNQHNESYRHLSDGFNQTDGEIGVIDERIKSYNNDLMRLDMEIKVLKTQFAENEVRKNKERVQNKHISEQMIEVDAAFNEAEAEHHRLSEALKTLTEQYDGSRTEIISLLNEIERNKSDKKHILENRQRFEYQRNALKEEMEKSESLSNAFEIELQSFEKMHSDLQLKRDDFKRQVSGQDNQKQLQTEQLNQLQQKKQHAQVEFEKSKTELKMLKNMELNMEGFDYGVKNLIGHLKKTNDLNGFVGVVADLIQIPPTMETAIDIALGKGLQNVVCSDEQVVKRMIVVLKSQKYGRVTFLPLSNLQANKQVVANEIRQSEGFLGLASELIEYDEMVRPAVEYLLSRTLIFKDYDSAAKALKIKQNRLRIVTLDGDLLIPGGAITGGSVKQKTTGVLNRKSKIEQLEKDVMLMETSLGHMDKAFEDIQKILFQIKGNREALEGDLQSVERHIQELSLKWNGLKMQCDQSEISKGKLTRDFDGLAEEMNKLDARVVLLEVQFDEKMKLVEQLEVSMKRGSLDQENLTTTFSEVSQTRTNLAVKIAGDREKQEASNRELHRLELLIAEQSEGVANKEKQILSIDVKKQNSLSEKDKNFSKKVSLLEEIDQIKMTIASLGSEKEKFRTDLQTKSDRLGQIALDLEAASYRMHALDIENTKWSVEKENVVKSIESLYEMTVEEAYGLRKPLDEKVVTQRAKQIKSRLKELGDVNTGSIKEHEEVSERYHFLKEQMDDLIKGQNVLKKMIRELDVTMQEQYVETFEAIRANFSEVFKSLFNGGTADLRIEDEENILESDIEIFAQPPGKKLQSLNLLSGGERSLTAIALLFSTLRYKPAPFCMLDEIEAALDDVNVYRFAAFLKEFSVDSQFVIITHRKGTMEIADILYGVTMEEYGVSKIVSVKLEDVAV